MAPTSPLQRSAKVNNNENTNDVPHSVINVTTTGAGFDTFIPISPEIRTTDITAKFKIKMLTPIEGCPTYKIYKKELGGNALAITVPFEGGKRGYLGVVCSLEKFRAEAGVDWNVPELEGSYPAFSKNATEDTKKKEISEFTKRKKGIETVEVVEDLLKGMFLEATNKDCIVKLKDGIREYDGKSLRNLLAHVNRYGKMDDTVHRKIMDNFCKAPDMDLPINKYCTKQEEACKLPADTENLITNAAIVMQMTQHMGNITGLGKKTVKFKKRTAAQPTWNQGTLYFREAIEDTKDKNIVLGSETKLEANATMPGTACTEQRVSTR